MRFRSPFATAVAAAAAAMVFAVAIRPAAAAPILIDSFTRAQAPNPAVGTSQSPNAGASLITLDSPGLPTVGALFNSRDWGVFYTQDGGADPTAALFTATINTTVTAGGSQLVSMGKSAINSGTPYDTLSMNGQLSYFNGNASGVNFTTGSNSAVEISKSAGSLGGDVVPNGFAAIIVTDKVGRSSSYQISAGDWFSSTTLTIPYSSFVADTVGQPANFSNVQTLDVTWGWNLDGFNAAQRMGTVSSSVTLTEIALVPEPTQMVFVAGVGAALGAWRLRKLRRNRGESEVAAV